MVCGHTSHLVSFETRCDVWNLLLLINEPKRSLLRLRQHTGSQKSWNTLKNQNYKQNPIICIYTLFIYKKCSLRQSINILFYNHVSQSVELGPILAGEELSLSSYYHLLPLNLFTLQTGEFGAFHNFHSLLLPLSQLNWKVLLPWNLQKA